MTRYNILLPLTRLGLQGWMKANAACRLDEGTCQLEGQRAKAKGRLTLNLFFLQSWHSLPEYFAIQISRLHAHLKILQSGCKSTVSYLIWLLPWLSTYRAVVLWQTECNRKRCPHARTTRSSSVVRNRRGEVLIRSQYSEAKIYLLLVKKI